MLIQKNGLRLSRDTARCERRCKRALLERYGCWVGKRRMTRRRCERGAARGERLSGCRMMMMMMMTMLMLVLLAAYDDVAAAAAAAADAVGHQILKAKS